MDLHDFLALVERQINAALHAQGPPGLERSAILLEAGQHLTSAPGAKRARPRLTHAFGLIMGIDAEQLWPIAVAGEFIHGASLMHDDIVDDASLRRGRPTVNARWNNAVAVLGGDVMLCISIQTLASLPRVITHEAVEVVATMSRAAILEVESRGKIDLGLDAWTHIARGKTGALFGWCGRSPAQLAGDQEAMRRFSVCGEHLGLAFQLADDLKDLAVDEGKDRFADLINRNPSFPLLTAAAGSDAIARELRALWAREQISPEDATALGLRVLDTGAATATRDAMLREIEAAFDALGTYRERPGGQDIIDWANALCQLYLATTQLDR